MPAAIASHPQYPRRRRALPRLQNGLRSLGLGGVAEGTQHTRHILEGGMFLSSLVEGLQGLSLEIQEHEIVSGPQDLAQVIVAMTADSDRAAPELSQILKTIDQ